MSDLVYLALKGWAAVPTWYTSHPADESRFQTAVAELAATVGTDIDMRAIRRVLRQYRDESPTLLDGRPSDARLDALGQKILDALSIAHKSTARVISHS